MFAKSQSFMAIFTCCISSCCHFGRLRNSFTIKWYFVIEKTAKACNNSAYFFYIIGYNKINYNLQKKASFKILLGGAMAPLAPRLPPPLNFLLFLLLTFDIIDSFSLCPAIDFEQVNICWIPLYQFITTEITYCCNY